MDSIYLSRLKEAVFGFVNSVGQTGTNMGDSLSHLGVSIQDKLPQFSLFSRSPPPPPPSNSLSDSVVEWVINHKWLVITTASLLSATGIYYTRKHYRCSQNRCSSHIAKENKRRTARRADDGGRCEVVLIVGSPSAPLVRLIAHDLNVRGFIVYITSTSAEEILVQKENSGDIRPLIVNSLLDSEQVKQSIQQFNSILESPVTSFAGATPHYLSLAGVLIVVDLVYPSGPLEAMSSGDWTETLQYNILAPVNFLGAGGIELVRNTNSRFVLLSPVIVGSLSLPYYAPEATVVGALNGLILSLYRELSSQYIPVTHIRLGSFDTKNVRMPMSSRLASPPAGNNPDVKSAIQADILTWPEDIRRIYGRGYRASAQWSSSASPSCGASLMSLYFAIYDVLKMTSPPRVVHVGQGSRLYDFLASWAPEKLVTLLATSSAN